LSRNTPIRAADWSVGSVLLTAQNAASDPSPCALIAAQFKLPKEYSQRTACGFIAPFAVPELNSLITAALGLNVAIYNLYNFNPNGVSDVCQLLLPRAAALSRRTAVCTVHLVVLMQKFTVQIKKSHSVRNDRAALKRKDTCFENEDGAENEFKSGRSWLVATYFAFVFLTVT
jgi:hypothetical protein